MEPGVGGTSSERTFDGESVQRELRGVRLGIADDAGLVVDHRDFAVVLEPQIHRAPDQRAFNIDDEIPLAFRTRRRGRSCSEFTAEKYICQLLRLRRPGARFPGEDLMDRRSEICRGYFGTFVFLWQILRVDIGKASSVPADVTLQ